MSNRKVERGWISLDEAAAYLGIGREKVRRAAYSGELEARIRPQGISYEQQRLAFHRDGLDAWVRTYWKNPADSRETKKRTPKPASTGVPNLKEVK